MAHLVTFPLTRVVCARQLPDQIMVQVYKIITGEKEGEKGVACEGEVALAVCVLFRIPHSLL